MGLQSLLLTDQNVQVHFGQCMYLDLDFR